MTASTPISTTSDAIADHLQTYLTDPAAPDRTRWVYIERPAKDANYPVIVVSLFGTLEEVGLGQATAHGKGQAVNFNVNIKVIVRIGDVHSGKSDVELVDDICDDVIVEMSKQRFKDAITNYRNIVPASIGNVDEDMSGELYERSMSWTLSVSMVSE